MGMPYGASSTNPMSKKNIEVWKQSIKKNFETYEDDK